ncbi:MAG: aldo/keto reductase [Acidobacteriaceae bacterium]
MNETLETGYCAVDRALVPRRQLNSGALMPAIGLGTFGSDHVEHSVVAEAVKTAAEMGYRHFDCASVYGNESHIGQSLAAVRGVGRWMRTNGEAIYSTRPFSVYGEGAPDVTSAHNFNEATARAFSASDIRFTTKGD